MSVIIIGAGAAGCEAAFRLAEAGIQVEVVEKENQPGGNLNNWYQLFPDRRFPYFRCYPQRRIRLWHL